MPVPQNPSVVIYLTGLLVLCFDEKFDYCQVGIHSKTDDHEVNLRLVKKRVDQATSSEQTLTISHDLIRHAADLWLEVEGPSSPKQQPVTLFTTGAPEQPPTDPQDFRRVVDMEGEYFYDRPLKLKRGVLKPSLFIARGLFYSATLTADSYRTLPVMPSGAAHSHEHAAVATESSSTGHSLGKIAEIVGVNIDLDQADQALVLRAGRKGSELLRLKNEEGVTYEITIDNGPTSQASVGSHFGYYYDAVDLDPGVPQILVEIESEGITPLSRDTSLCNAIQISKSNSLG